MEITGVPGKGQFQMLETGKFVREGNVGFVALCQTLGETSKVTGMIDLLLAFMQQNGWKEFHVTRVD